MDTAASVYTSGLLGEQYVGLDPGAAQEYLRGGSEIRFTQSALVLEKVIGQFLFSKGEGGGNTVVAPYPAGESEPDLDALLEAFGE
jgi:phospholipid/cholesterol/gamma-HCH transport system substrate-binding protein